MTLDSPWPNCSSLKSTPSRTTLVDCVSWRENVRLVQLQADRAAPAQARNKGGRMSLWTPCPGKSSHTLRSQQNSSAISETFLTPESLFSPKWQKQVASCCKWQCRVESIPSVPPTRGLEESHTQWRKVPPSASAQIFQLQSCGRLVAPRQPSRTPSLHKHCQELDVAHRQLVPAIRT